MSVRQAVAGEITTWQNRPLDPVWPIVYIDALWVKIRDGQVANRPVYLAVGVDLDGCKHVLGLWIGPSEGEGAKYWMSVLAELRNRGVADVLICCCDGLTGLPEAIAAIWPQATVQTCCVHLMRASLRFASKKDYPQLVPALKAIHTAPTETTAGQALTEFEDSPLGQRYPAIRHLIEPKGGDQNQAAPGWKSALNALTLNFGDRITIRSHHESSHKGPYTPS